MLSRLFSSCRRATRPVKPDMRSSCKSCPANLGLHSMSAHICYSQTDALGLVGSGRKRENPVYAYNRSSLCCLKRQEQLLGKLLPHQHHLHNQKALPAMSHEPGQQHMANSPDPPSLACKPAAKLQCKLAVQNVPTITCKTC